MKLHMESRMEHWARQQMTHLCGWSKSRDAADKSLPLSDSFKYMILHEYTHIYERGAGMIMLEK